MAHATDQALDEFGTADLRNRGRRQQEDDARSRAQYRDLRFPLPRPGSAGKKSARHADRAPWSKRGGQRARQRGRGRQPSCATCSSATMSTTRAGKLISTVNCVVKRDETPGRQQELAERVLGRQADDLRPGDLQRRGCARSPSSLDVVAHELFHGVTAATARSVYQGEPGALEQILFGHFRHLRFQSRRAGHSASGTG